MSHFNRMDATLEDETDERPPPRARFADLAGRVGDWFAGVEREPDEDDDGRGYDVRYEPVDGYDRDGHEEPRPEPRVRARRFTPRAPAPERGAGAADPLDQLSGEIAAGEDEDVAPAFPLAPFGYNRVAVDERISELEREVAALAAREQPPMSITDEIERIGEQTASILVVAHDQAHETTRRAQEQAERCIADAAANAVAITTEAKQRLQELDAETDVVWRERERLLEDVRVVSAALGTLADEASARFPAESKTAESPAAPVRAQPVNGNRPAAAGLAAPDAPAEAPVTKEPAPSSSRSAWSPSPAWPPAGEPSGPAAWTAPGERSGAAERPAVPESEQRPSPSHWRVPPS